MDASDFLFPQQLSVTKTPIERVLLVGSCVIEGYHRHFTQLVPDIRFDKLLFNHVAILPDLSAEEIASYDFQYILLPLRYVVTDAVIAFREFIADPQKILDKARQALRLMLEAALKYNTSHSLLTFVANFSVPQSPVVPALVSIGTTADFARVVRALNDELVTLVQEHKNTYIADIDSLGSSLGKRYYHDDAFAFFSHGAFWEPTWVHLDLAPALNGAGRIEALPDLDELYGSRLSEMESAVWRQAVTLYRIVHQIDQVKLVIFDLDDTLWRGQIAEHYGEGAASPHVHGWPLGIWEAVQHLRARGILTAICSRNDETLVRRRWDRAVVEPWVAMEDFLFREINWTPKAQSLDRIIKAAGVTPKSTVFVDDNPVERESVKAALPGIRVIGDNPYTTRRILLWSSETQIPFLSQESIAREHSMRRIQVRESDRQALSREDFLRQLNCSVRIREITSTHDKSFARAFELLNKTNQFNTTGARWSEAEISHFVTSQGKLYCFRVEDRYTKYGLVGVILYRGDTFVQFAMSCRVLGLDIETSVLHLIMGEQRKPCYRAEVRETDSNMASRDVYLRCGFVPTSDGTQVRFGGTPGGVAAHLKIAIDRGAHM